MINKKEIFEIRETGINATEGYIFYDITHNASDIQIKTLSELYKYGIKMFGKCQGKVYVDSDNGNPIHVGYTFIKKQKYADTGETYLQETIISIEHYIKETKITYLEVE